MKFNTAFALVVTMLTIESRFDVVASSSFSGLDGSDPQVTRKTTRRVLNHKNKDSCKQEKTTIAGLEGEIIEMKQEIAGLEGEISELKQEIDGDNGEIVGGNLDFDDTDHSATVEKLTTSYFRNDDFWDTVPGGRMMKSYGSGGDDLTRRHDAYDNAMAVQFLIRQESTVDRANAKDILSAFAYQMYCDQESKPDDGWRSDWTASGESVQLFPQVFMTDNVDQTTPKGSWQGPYAVGNNVYVALAFAHASAVLFDDENNVCYALAAYDMLDALWKTRKCALHDFPTEVGGGRVNTESMSDWKGLLNTLNLYKEYDTQMTGAVDLFEKAYNEDDPSYFQSMMCSDPLYGTDEYYEYAHPADTTFWSAMAEVQFIPDLINSETKYSDNMINAMRNVYSMVNIENEQSDIDTYQGFDYNGFKFSSKGNHIQWELTASAGAMSMMHSLDKHEAQLKSEGLYDLFQSRKTAYLASITHLIETSGSVPGSVQSGGSLTIPGGNSYMPVAHLASSSWSGLALLMDDASYKNEFNVFAAQIGMMPRTEARSGYKCANIKQKLAKCPN